MTMHLERGLTTLNTKKRKVKRKSDAFYVDGWREQNKFWKKHKLPEMELSEYIDYIHGKWKPKTPRKLETLVFSPKVVNKHDTTIRKEKKLDPVKLGNGKSTNWKEQQERLEISKQYTIAPAYNKGPYMVVAKSDIKTAGRKV